MPSKLDRKLKQAAKYAAKTEATASVNRKLAAAIKDKAVDGPAIRRMLPKPKNRLEAKLREAEVGGLVHRATQSEINRIVGLPIFDDLTEEEIDAISYEECLAEAYDEGFRLFGTQAASLLAYRRCGGLVGPIGVGWGKTLISLMIAHEMHTVRGHKTQILAIPPEVLDQFKDMLREARSKIPFSVPVHLLGGRTPQKRKLMCESGKRGLYVMPYSLFSVRDTSEMLAAIDADGIILDEAHRMARRKAARTMRLMRYLDEREKQGRPADLVALSGSITSKTIRDYGHLARHALREWNFLPNDTSQMDEWAALVDSEADGSGNTGPLLPLCAWAQKNYPDEPGGFPESVPGFRRAYRRRLSSSPGVVSSGDNEIACSLILCNQPVTGFEKEPGWQQLEELISGVEDEWITPNGDEIEHAIHTWKWLFELSAGFYNELIWPTAEELSRKRGCTLREAEVLLDRARQHHAAGQEYARDLRDFLALGRTGLDTPFLVGGDMNKHGDKNVPSSLYRLWKTWHDLDFGGRPERNSRAVRVCPFKVKAAARWAADLDGGGLIWVYHKEVGEWCHQVLREAGIEAIYCPAGSQHNRRILDPKNKDKVIVASMTAHGTGKNLQHFSEQLFLQWPRDPKAAEQTLGRTHRNGQEADELFVRTLHTLDFDRSNFAACLNDALYIHQTTGNRQKLIYCGYSPLPAIMPPEVLRERGFGNKMLSTEQRRLLHDKFGEDS